MGANDKAAATFHGDPAQARLEDLAVDQISPATEARQRYEDGEEEYSDAVEHPETGEPLILAPDVTLPIGTPVTYWPGVHEGPGIESFTRSNIWHVGGHPVVLVQGRAGGIALTHIARRVDVAAIKADALREAAQAQRQLAADARTGNGKAEHEDRADWLDDQANAIDPRRLEGAHP